MIDNLHRECCVGREFLSLIFATNGGFARLNNVVNRMETFASDKLRRRHMNSCSYVRTRLTVLEIEFSSLIFATNSDFVRFDKLRHELALANFRNTIETFEIALPFLGRVVLRNASGGSRACDECPTIRVRDRHESMIDNLHRKRVSVMSHNL